MFKLKSETGGDLLMKSGAPFIYSSRELAEMGSRALYATKGPSFAVAL
jgi:hypothetical protein